MVFYISPRFLFVGGTFFASTMTRTTFLIQQEASRLGLPPPLGFPYDTYVFALLPGFFPAHKTIERLVSSASTVAKLLSAKQVKEVEGLLASSSTSIVVVRWFPTTNIVVADVECLLDDH